MTVSFTNETDLETTVHWHSLRLDHEFDGVPHGRLHHGMQPPIPTGESVAYRVRCPDAGVYWYHPHIRKDTVPTTPHSNVGCILSLWEVAGLTLQTLPVLGVAANAYLICYAWAQRQLSGRH